MASRLTPRQYDLLLTRSQKFAIAVPLLMLFLVPLVVLSVFSFSGAAPPEQALPPFFPLFPLVFFLAFAVFYGWTVGKLPYRITVTAGQLIEFKSLLSVQTARVSELLSIEPRSLRVKVGISGYVLIHRDGKILFPGQFTGLHILLTELKNANPALEIRGC